MATKPLLVPIEFTPGLDRDNTEYAKEGKWYSADKVRFKAGSPETIGNWQGYFENQFKGIARKQIQWSLLNGQNLVGIGTHSHLYAWNGGTFYDLTPVCVSNTFPGIINTYAGETSIMVSANNHGRTVGSYIIFDSASAVGNVDVSGREFLITSVLSAHEIVIANTTVATITSSGGGNVAFRLPVNAGLQSNTLAGGWGRGTWDEGAYGVPTDTSGIQLQMRLWNLNNWGEDLLANYKGGPLYYWDATNGLGTRAVMVTAAPSIIDYSYISEPTRHFMMVGTTNITDGTYDPLLVRWSSDGDFTDVIPSGTNTAGDFRLDGGSKCYGVRQTKNEALIWTDTTLFRQTYTGDPLYFSHENLGDNTGLMGPMAMEEIGGTIIWMGLNNFYKYNGAIEVLPCPLRKDIFDVGGDYRVNYNQKEKTYAGINTAFNEITWFYQSENSTTDEIDRYVTYNYVENIWYDGYFNRTTWHDSGLMDSILATGDDGYMYSHELGFLEGNEEFDTYLESAAFDIENGDELLVISKIVPDLDVRDKVQFTLYTKDYPNGSWKETGPFEVTQGTEKIDVRGARGRQAKIRITSSGLNSAWRLGKVRFALKKNGRRG